MPNYAYMCNNTEHHESGKPFVFEMVKPLSRSSESEVCPLCSGECTRFFGVGMPAFHLKGLGFYTTDEQHKTQLKEAYQIADHAYTAKAEGAPKISEDLGFWDDLSRNFESNKWW